MHSSPTPSFDVVLMRDDLARKGWLPVDLARKAKVSHMTVGRFFTGEHRTPRTAKKLAKALGHSIDRYLVAASEAVAS